MNGSHGGGRVVRCAGFGHTIPDVARDPAVAGFAPKVHSARSLMVGTVRLLAKCEADVSARPISSVHTCLDYVRRFNTFQDPPTSYACPHGRHNLRA